MSRSTDISLFPDLITSGCEREQRMIHPVLDPLWQPPGVYVVIREHGSSYDQQEVVCQRSLPGLLPFIQVR